MKGLLATIRWHDAIDVALCAAIVYRVLAAFRGTRAVQMVLGLGVLVAGTVLARRLELHTLRWLLDNFWSFWVVALVVLFQPELRRALTRMGEGRLVRSLVGVSSHERVRVVEEVASAVEALASRRTGALVVLERAVGLRQYAELGVPLEALVSADLLVSLFQPSSPLHDGAVLIQGSRAIAAGCFLPLSRNVHIGRALGTRHRAALGISEETDAVALTVSEETGRISIAIEGQLEPANDGEVVRSRLHDLLVGELVGASETSLVRGVRRWLPGTHDSAQNSG